MTDYNALEMFDVARKTYSDDDLEGLSEDMKVVAADTLHYSSLAKVMANVAHQNRYKGKYNAARLEYHCLAARACEIVGQELEKEQHLDQALKFALMSKK